MKTYLLRFVQRGLLAASGGPVIVAIIYAILGANGVIDTLTPNEVCLGILSGTLLAFIAAGAGVVYEIDRLPMFAAALIHGAALYLDYILIYLINGWLQTQWIAVSIFTACFVIGYGIIWLIIMIITKVNAGRLNDQLRNEQQ